MQTAYYGAFGRIYADVHDRVYKLWRSPPACLRHVLPANLFTAMKPSERRELKERSEALAKVRMALHDINNS